MNTDCLSEAGCTHLTDFKRLHLGVHTRSTQMPSLRLIKKKKKIPWERGKAWLLKIPRKNSKIALYVWTKTSSETWEIFLRFRTQATHLKVNLCQTKNSPQSKSSRYLAFICHIVIILLIQIKPLSQALHPMCEYNNYQGAQKGGGFQSSVLSWEQTFWLWQQEGNMILTYVGTEMWICWWNPINYRFVKVLQSSGSDLQWELKNQGCFSYLVFQSLQVPHYQGVCLFVKQLKASVKVFHFN